MGLDNLIILKLKRKLTADDFASEDEMIHVLNNTFVDCIAENENEYEYTICYWRKCWNIRDSIMDIIDDPNADGAETEIARPQVESIRNELCEYLVRGEGAWNDSIWEFNEMIERLANDIVALGWLERFMTRNTARCEVTFVDSY